jgi:CBS domain-containing protein
MASETSLSTSPPATGGRLDTPVRDIMRRGVLVIAKSASVADAQRAMLSHGVHAILVLERCSTRIVGWVTSHGLLSWCDRDIPPTPVHNAVNEAPLTIHPSASVRDSLNLMKRHGAAHLLVTHRHDGLPEGVVSDVDVLRLVAD